MSSPSSSTLPVIQPCSDNSCIRFRVRRKVDLPQPEGPIRAWTWLLSKASDTPLTAVNLPYMAVSLSVSTRIRRGFVVGAAAVFTVLSLRSGLTAASGIEVESPPDGESGAETEDQDDQNEDECRCPGVAMPLFIGARRI